MCYRADKAKTALDIARERGHYNVIRYLQYVHQKRFQPIIRPEAEQNDTELDKYSNDSSNTLQVPCNNNVPDVIVEEAIEDINHEEEDSNPHEAKIKELQNYLSELMEHLDVVMESKKQEVKHKYR